MFVFDRGEQVMVKVWLLKNVVALSLLAVGLLVLLAGCAGDALHREGMAALSEGRLEEGLGKLAAAAQSDPENLEYRHASMRNRELVLAGLIGAATNERSNGRLDAAQAAFERVLRIDPEHVRAKEGLQALAMDKRHAGAVAAATDALKKGETESARAALKAVLIENAKNAPALALQRQIDEQTTREQLAAPVLEGKFKKPITLQFRDANLKMVLEALSRTSGINVLVDRDVKGDLKTSIFVKDVSVEDTINLILLQSQLEKKIVGENTIFVYPSTPAKLKEHQDLKIRSFHLTSADPKQMQTMLKSLLKTKDIFIHEKTNSLVMRDTPEAIRVAEKLIADQDFEEPEVMLEVEVLEVARERLTDIGIKFPTQLAVTAVGGTGPGGVLTVDDLRRINGSTLATSPPLSLTANLKLQDSEANVLASPRIRAKNHEKAKIMIGDRVPVITNAITPVSTGTPVVTGNVQYLDVGLKLEVEPDIHPDNEVVIKVNLDVSSIIKEVQNAQSGTLAYQVGTRNTSTVLRLRDGETQILAGLINSEEQRNAAKVPGLGQIPVLGRLFSDHSGDTKKTEIVLSITPRIVGTPHVPAAKDIEYWTGTESSLKSELLTLRSTGTIAQNGNGDIGAAFRRATPPQPSAPAVALPTGLSAAAPALPVTVAPPLTLSWQGPSRAKVGERIGVRLNADAAEAVGGIGFTVAYDPKVLRATTVGDGDFYKQADPVPTLKSTIHESVGRIEVVVPASGAKGASGAGSVAAMEFEVIGAAAAAQITLSRVVLSATGGAALPVAAPQPLGLAVLP
ncbi:MAG: secretin and TonB N-terminal domain-containing protein [Rhodocyclales bacterium]|nr:secretin and TonB N-terminal domain-containing protein [Rhodocyclales bacterium]